MPTTAEERAEIQKLEYKPSGNKSPLGKTTDDIPHAAEWEYDNLMIADMKVKGYTWDEIAQKVHLDPDTVYKKWMSIKSHWRKRRLAIVDEYFDIELNKLQALEDEYWRSYRASINVIHYELNSEDGLVQAKEGILNPGDPRYLDGVLKCMGDRAKRLGLYKTEQAVGELADTVRTVLELPTGEDNARTISAIADAIEHIRSTENAN